MAKTRTSRAKTRATTKRRSTTRPKAKARSKPKTRAKAKTRTKGKARTKPAKAASARTSTRTTSAAPVWPGLPPGYFDRAR
jgi:hypothetical protein